MRSRTFLLASLLFLLSGALGLGYELLWIRKSLLVVGASQIALSTVLTSFFLGIALGSRFVGRHLRSSRFSPLVLYGLFELVIGVFALAFPWLFEVLEAIYGAAYASLSFSAGLVFALRFGLLFALVLVPTFFMGGTLPLLLDGLIAEDARVGARTSVLYGINILGAVLGVLVTCYWAIPTLGVSTSSVLGGVGNLLIGLVAILLFRRERPIHAVDGAGVEAPKEAPKPAKAIAVPELSRPRGSRFFPAAAFLSGLLAIGYQIAWARYFTLFHTTSVYITAVLLAVYLLALAVGAFLLAPLLARGKNPLRILAIVQAFVPIAALYCLRWWTHADHTVALRGGFEMLEGERYTFLLPTHEINPDYRHFFLFASENLDAIFFAPLFQISLVIFLPVVLLGAGLPSLIAAATRRSSEVRETAGSLVFWNTLGASAGGFLAGYALIPLLGLHGTMVALGVGSLLLSCLALWRAPTLDASASVARGKRPLLGFTSGLVVAAALGVVVWVLTSENLSRDTIRRFGYGRNPGIETMELVEVYDGPLATAWVFDDENSIQVGSGHVSLAVNYKKSFSTQAIQGHVPLLFYPGTETPRDCLGICLGSGQSFGALLLYEIAKLDVVDISPEMVRLSFRYFEEYNHGLEKDPRVTLHIDDGRHFIDRAPDASYDVISMEPPPPTADGIYSLYSREFYESVRRVLRPTGVFMQWLPLYRVTPKDTAGIIRTQAEIFPETFVVKVGRDDFMVLSYPEPPRFVESVQRSRAEIFRTERNVAGQKWAGRCQHEIASLEGVRSLLLMGPATIRETLSDAMVHDDEHQLLAYSSGDRYLLRRYRGPALSPIAFTGMKLSPYAELAGVFDPPIDAAAARALEAERARSLWFFNSYLQAPFALALEKEKKEEAEAGLRFIDGLDSYEVAAAVAEQGASRNPFVSAALALSIARAYDAILDKENAFFWIDRALRAFPTNDNAAHARLARRIVENRLAVYEPVVARWLKDLDQAHGSSAILRTMRAMHAVYLEEARRIDARYLFGR